MSSKCLGVDACRPVSTYCPGLPCDSRTKKSPSFFNKLSAAGRLIAQWNHVSVISCDRCTSAVSENGSGNSPNLLAQNSDKNFIVTTYACRIHPGPVCCCCWNLFHLHNRDPAVDCSSQWDCYWVVRVVSEFVFRFLNVFQQRRNQRSITCRT